ncbi:MAG: HAMP domain-containing sensor histidine kinase, partial [Pseudoflavonifractor sp.]
RGGQGMQTVLIVILAAVCVCLAFFLYTSQKGLRSCIRQLKKRSSTGDLTPLRLDVPSAATEELVTLINGILQSKAEDAAAYHAGEKALRRQIANVSHDLQTPLTSILGYLQLLQEDRLSDAERAEYLAIVKSRAKALQSLITSFYDLSRLDSGEYPLEETQVDLYPLLSQLVADFYNDLTASGLQVNVALEEQIPPVRGDPAAVLRVFTNLIRNALDHAKGNLEIRLYLEDGRVVTGFQNGSEGLAEEDLAHVFDRSFTSDQNRTARNAGLGLAIVRALTEQMGAHAEARLKNDQFSVLIRWKK